MGVVGMSALDVVNGMIRALEQRDVETALSFMAEDIEYDNVPMGKVFGHDGVRTSLTPFLAACSEVEWVIHHEAARSLKSRVQVVAEAVEARRLGVLGGGEASVLPTAAQLERIQMAGLNATPMNVARR